MIRVRQPPDIPAILRRVAAGDRAAYGDIVRHYQGPLFGFLGRMGLAQAQADDVAQEALLRAWQSLAGYRPEKAAFSTWLFTIARNLAIDELTREHRRVDKPSNDPLPEVVSDTPEPLELLVRAQCVDRVRAALRQLPMVDRSVLALVYVNELDLTQVARVEGCSSGAIKVRLFRARQRLRELLEDIDD